MSQTIDFDISNTWVTGSAFEKARDKIKELFDYVPAGKFNPGEIFLFPADYKALRGAIQRGLNKRAKEATREANRIAKSKTKIIIAPDRCGEITWRGIPIREGYRQSKPRAVKP